MLLKNKNTKKDEKKDIRANPPWWVNPPLFLLFFLLPLFTLTVLVSGPYMAELGQSVNNITPENIRIALLSIAMLTIGASVFAFSADKSSGVPEYEQSSVKRALLFMGIISLVSNLILFIPLAMRPDLVVYFVLGNAGAMYEIRETLGQIPGITSFVIASMPFFSLYSFATIKNSPYSVTPFIKRLFYLLFLFVIARALLNSERLALITAVTTYMIPRIVFEWKPSILRFYTPLIGVVGVFAIFSWGEYFRSWQHYKLYFSNFLEFISVRFLGYFSISINNGAGVITYYEPVGYPFYTASWFFKLLGVFNIDVGEKPTIVADYLLRYATPEFNNPGGLYIPYMDYGLIGGAGFFFLTGILTGWLYSLFLKARPLGILLFPFWFIGCLDIIRILYWAGSGTIPILSVVFIAVLIIKTYDKPSIPLKKIGKFQNKA
jgi:oligosaccharide repeat unit polymerase